MLEIIFKEHAESLVGIRRKDTSSIEKNMEQMNKQDSHWDGFKINCSQVDMLQDKFTLQIIHGKDHSKMDVLAESDISVQQIIRNTMCETTLNLIATPYWQSF